MRTALAATFLIVILAMSCAYCAASPPINSRIGGPGWRVMDAEQIDMPEAIEVLRGMHAEVEDCTGESRPFRHARFYSVSGIHVRYSGGWTNAIGGLTVGHRIYIKRTMPKSYIPWVAKHELVHYVTRLGHPESDEALKACEVYQRTGTTE